MMRPDFYSVLFEFMASNGPFVVYLSLRFVGLNKDPSYINLTELSDYGVKTFLFELVALVV